jgi:hypothetical protein
VKPGLVDDIKSRGHWRINFRPVVLDDPLPSLTQARDLVIENRVSLRGWDYPHIPVQRPDLSSGITMHDAHVEAWTDWDTHREIWRMYLSSQFIHLVALHEDWTENRQWAAPGDDFQPGTQLSIRGGIWHIAEFYEFLGRLMTRGLYSAGADCRIELVNTAGRALWAEPGRVPFDLAQVTSADTIRFARTWQPANFSAREAAVETAQVIFDRFGWAVRPEQLAAVVDELHQLPR